MRSKIESNLKMDLNSVVIIWSNHKPDNALQYKPNKFNYSIHLAVQVVNGKTAVFDADASGCFTALAAFGLAKMQDK